MTTKVIFYTLLLCIITKTSTFQYNDWTEMTPLLPLDVYNQIIGYENNTIWLLGGFGGYDQVHHLWSFNYLTQKFAEPSYWFNEIIQSNGQSYTQIASVIYFGTYGGSHISSFDMKTTAYTAQYSLPPLDVYNDLSRSCITAIRSKYIAVLGVDRIVQILDVQQNSWLDSVPSTHFKRSPNVCIYANDKIFVIGSRSCCFTPIIIIEYLNVSPSAMTNIASVSWNNNTQNLPNWVKEHRLILVNDDILVIGGYPDHPVYVIGSITGSVSVGGYLSKYVESTTGIFVDNIAYSFGGYRSQDGWRGWQILPGIPTTAPTRAPTSEPTEPTFAPTMNPTTNPTETTANPTTVPTSTPTSYPSTKPTANPTSNPTTDPTRDPTRDPTTDPTAEPTTSDPTSSPTHPTNYPTGNPSAHPTFAPFGYAGINCGSNKYCYHQEVSLTNLQMVETAIIAASTVDNGADITYDFRFYISDTSEYACYFPRLSIVIQDMDFDSVVSNEFLDIYHNGNEFMRRCGSLPHDSLCITDPPTTTCYDDYYFGNMVIESGEYVHFTLIKGAGVNIYCGYSMVAGIKINCNNFNNIPVISTITHDMCHYNSVYKTYEIMDASNEYYYKLSIERYESSVTFQNCDTVSNGNAFIDMYKENDMFNSIQKSYCVNDTCGDCPYNNRQHFAMPLVPGNYYIKISCTSSCNYVLQICGCVTTASPTLKPTANPTNPTPAPIPTSAPIPTTQNPTSPTTKHPTSPPIYPTSASPTSPTEHPSLYPTRSPIERCPTIPTTEPTDNPTLTPTFSTKQPTILPTTIPTIHPTVIPTQSPTPSPTAFPTTYPTTQPTSNPSVEPTLPTTTPTFNPTVEPTFYPTFEPTSTTFAPTTMPTVHPTETTIMPTYYPTKMSTLYPTKMPTLYPTKIPTISPTLDPIQTSTMITSSIDKKQNNTMDSDDTASIIIIIVCVLLPILLIVIFVIYCVLKKKQSKQLSLDKAQIDTNGIQNDDEKENVKATNLALTQNRNEGGLNTDIDNTLQS